MGFIKQKELTVRCAEQTAVEFLLDKQVKSLFLGDDQPIRHQFKGKTIYVWLVSDTNRHAFSFERESGVFRLTDSNEKTREASILRMLLQAQQVFGDGGFELSGDDDFVNLAYEIAERNNIQIFKVPTGPHP